MKKLMKLLTFILLPTIAIGAPRLSDNFNSSDSVRVKEGGNSVLNSDGTLVSFDLNCIVKDKLNDFIHDKNIEQFSSLINSYKRMTYKNINTHDVSVCVLNNKNDELSRIIGAPAVNNATEERVAGWLSNFNGERTVFLSNQLLTDIDSGIKSRTIETLGSVIFREVLHGELDKKQTDLNWSRRDYIVSEVFKDILNVKNGKIKITRSEFQKINSKLEQLGFPSGFEIDTKLGSSIASLTGTPITRLIEFENFLQYLELAAGRIKDSYDMQKYVLEQLIVNCVESSLEFGVSCSENYRKVIGILEKYNQKFRFYFKKMDFRKNLTSYSAYLINITRQAYAVKHNLFVPYTSVDKDTFNSDDIIELIKEMKKHERVVYFSEEFLLVGFLHADFLSTVDDFLGLIPFIQNELISTSTKFSCTDRQDEFGIRLFELYAAAQMSITNKDYLKKVNKILAIELDDEFKKKNDRTIESVMDTLKYVIDNNCYVFM